MFDGKERGNNMSMTKKTINALFENVLNKADQDDETVLTALLEGMQQKQQGVSRTYINGTLNYKGEMAGEKTYKAEISLNPFVNNPLQIVHGGITATFADTAMGTLVNKVLDDDHTSVTSELKINYLKPATGEKLFCKAEVVHQGKSLCFVTATLMTDLGKTVAFASGSFFVVPIPENLKKSC